MRRASLEVLNGVRMNPPISRRRFLTGTGALAGVGIAVGSPRLPNFALSVRVGFNRQSRDQTGADYTLHIKNSPIEIAPKRIISATTYNGQGPGRRRGADLHSPNSPTMNRMGRPSASPGLKAAKLFGNR
jgi:hypothetical protein